MKSQVEACCYENRRPKCNIRILGILICLFVLSSGLLINITIGDTWRGTAPFCEGECLRGEQEVRRSNCGDGACCWTGSKVLCRNSAPTCQPQQTRTKCYGVVLICDNGYYTHENPPVWHSCSKYACGACAKFPWGRNRQEP